MKEIFTIILLILVINNILHAQSFINGDFESTTAANDQINLSNAAFNSMFSNTFAFGTQGDMDIIKTNTYCSFPQSGTWFVALTGDGTDAISMQLSSPVIAGNTYTISFFDEGCNGFSVGASPVQVGVSTVNNTFGTLVYTGPLPADGAWTNHTFSFISPLTAPYITVQLQGGSLYNWTQVDNFVISVTPLPVTLLSFTARSIDCTVELSWSTASENNNDFFNVERSAEENNFESVGRIKGSGSSTSTHSYTFEDKYPLNGMSYYRLKQTDFNGRFSYSDIQSVIFNCKDNFSFRVFPNPASAETVISYTLGSAESAEVKITNIYGREISTFVNETNSEGIHFIHVNTENFSPGTYICELITNSGQQIKKLTIFK